MRQFLAFLTFIVLLGGLVVAPLLHWFGGTISTIIAYRLGRPHVTQLTYDAGFKVYGPHELPTGYKYILNAVLPLSEGDKQKKKVVYTIYGRGHIVDVTQSEIGQNPEQVEKWHQEYKQKKNSIPFTTKGGADGYFYYEDGPLIDTGVNTAVFLSDTEVKIHVNSDSPVDENTLLAFANAMYDTPNYICTSNGKGLDIGDSIHGILCIIDW
jgi:hypothetical protein